MWLTRERIASSAVIVVLGPALVLVVATWASTFTRDLVAR
jgi:hypothetical protein